MKQLLLTLLIAIGAAMFAACPPGTETGNTNGSNTNGEEAEKSLQAAIEEIDDQFGVEMSKKNVAFFEENVADNLVGQGPQGRMDKPMGVHFIKTNKCESKSDPATERKVHELSDDVALLTGKSSGERTCDGKTEKMAGRYAVLWVKDGDKWKAAFYHGIPLPANEEAKADDAEKDEEKPAADAEAKKEDKTAAEGAADEAAPMPKENAPNDAELAKTLLDIEKTLWEAFAKNDTKPFEERLAAEFVSLRPTGEADRAAELKSIGEHKCEVKSWSLSEEKATKVNDNFVILTYKGNQDGTCGDEALDKVIYTSTIFMKDGDTWKPVFHANTPAMPSA
ncbi:MAG TPA: nuclear transport factor 2 family protein [Aridibacter sp.]|nr:nuclear transport factor 2 family protein [Aridibacter sp.]